MVLVVQVGLSKFLECIRHAQVDEALVRGGDGEVEGPLVDFAEGDLQRLDVAFTQV